MIFYVLTVNGATAGAYRYKREAVAESEEYLTSDVEIVAVDIDMRPAAEVVRRLLGQEGGYARSMRTVYMRERT